MARRGASERPGTFLSTVIVGVERHTRIRRIKERMIVSLLPQQRQSLSVAKRAILARMSSVDLVHSIGCVGGGALAVDPSPTAALLGSRIFSIIGNICKFRN